MEITHYQRMTSKSVAVFTPRGIAFLDAPPIDNDLYAYFFRRAHIYAIRQYGVEFYRLIDGEWKPFVEYAGSLMPPHTDIANLETAAREQFRRDMADQNVWVNFV